MSSPLRTITKRILKRMKYERQTQRVELRNGSPVIVKLKKGEGPILGPDSEPVGRHWPRFLPTGAPDRQTPRKGPPRGSRRGTHKNPRRSVPHPVSAPEPKAPASEPVGDQKVPSGAVACVSREAK